MKITLTKVLFFASIFFLTLFVPKSTFAADYTTDYKVEYTLKDYKQTISSDVNFNVKITHHRSDVFVKKFILMFPAVFPIKNIRAQDDRGEIKPHLTENEDMLKIELEFNNPNTGKDSVNNFFIEFTQDNLFRINGNVWEVILPTIENRDDGRYQVIVNLPENSDKKISVAKPSVDIIKNNQLIWNDPKTKTIYAIFGDKQYYRASLVYNLQNTKIASVYTDIAFPPDTLYQQIFVNKINPLPKKVFLDSDGNYMARYILKPKENKIVYFDGIIGIFSKSRDEFKKILDSQIQSQKNYLLTSKDYWKLASVDKYQGLNNTSDIFDYLINNFTYNYEKITSNTGRLGAEKALSNPDKVVCTEFTDSFIALAREKGIFAREMEGYGFSSDSILRPMSLTTDLLHAWPEFYDPKLKTWIQIDPTWQNTSGIDYYNSFDLNHIVFVIHGSNPRYPYPAGTYKNADSKDILLKPVNNTPQKTGALNLEVEDIKKTVYQQKKYQFKIKLINKSNIFVYSQQIKIETDKNLIINPSKKTVYQIAPYETREIVVNYASNKTLVKKNSFIKVFLNQKELVNQTITVLPWHYDLAIKFSYIGLGLSLVAFFIFYAKKRSR